MRASRVARGKKAGYPRGDEVGKVKGEGRRAHARLQFNQSSPRGCAPIRRPVNRKRSLGNLGSTGLRGCGRRGRAHRRSMRPYSALATPRPGWIFTRAHAFSLRLGFINRDRTPARIVSRFASFEICAAEVEEGGFVLGRVREREGDRDRL